MHVHDQSLAKTLSDVNFFCGRRNESVYWLVLLELLRYQFNSNQDLHRLHLLSRISTPPHAILHELSTPPKLFSSRNFKKMQSAQTASTCLIR
ncbi:hypothetical protein Tco_0953900 [Tanacetum coccineum]|uniref:Uncharacterized protein n=1 Tax=Tanacetum coccineum TaxID=301880 RepID=A0ABQ5E167_9ASTR